MTRFPSRVTRRIGLPVAIALALVGSSCLSSTDERADLRIAADDAVVATLDTDDAEADCVAELLTADAADLDRYAADGLTSTALTTDPGAILTIDGRTGGIIEDALLDCVDLRPRFGALPAVAALESLDPSCIDREVLAESDLAPVLIAPTGDRDDGGLADDERNALLLDLTRTCIDQTDLATLAGIPTPAELAAELTLDPFAPMDVVAAQDACIVDAMIATLGVEHFDEIGLAPDGRAAVLWRSGNVSASQRTEMTAAIVDCRPAEELLAASLDLDLPDPVVECVVDSVSDPLPIVEASLSTRAAETGLVDDEIEACGDAHIADAFGDQVVEDPDVLTLASETAAYLAFSTGFSSFAAECIARGYEIAFDAIDPELYFGPPPETFEDQREFDAMLAGIFRAQAECIDAADSVAAEMGYIDLDDDETWCVLSTLGDEVMATYLKSSIANLEWDLSAASGLYAALDEIEDAVEECAGSAARARWDAYINGDAVDVDA